jgi:hypothetical protein
MPTAEINNYLLESLNDLSEDYFKGNVIMSQRKYESGGATEESLS